MKALFGCLMLGSPEYNHPFSSTNDRSFDHLGFFVHANENVTLERGDRPLGRMDEWMGEAAGLGSAFLWALNNIVMGRLSARMPPAVVSAFRCLFGALFALLVLVIAVAVGKSGSVSSVAMVGLVASGVLSIGIGDTLYIRGLGTVGVSRAFPVSMALYPLGTFVLAVGLLGEQVTWRIVGGSLLICLGVVLIARARSAPQAQPTSDVNMSADSPRTGYLFVAVGSLLWAVGSVWLRAAADGVAPAVVQAVRLPVATVITFGIAYQAGHSVRLEHYGRGPLALLGFAGFVGTGVGSLLFVLALQEAGAGKTAVLSSTAPLFALPMAVLVLGEKVTASLIAGTLLSIAGIWLVV